MRSLEDFRCEWKPFKVAWTFNPNRPAIPWWTLNTGLLIFWTLFLLPFHPFLYPERYTDMWLSSEIWIRVLVMGKNWQASRNSWDCGKYSLQSQVEDQTSSNSEEEKYFDHKNSILTIDWQFIRKILCVNPSWPKVQLEIKLHMKA